MRTCPHVDISALAERVLAVFGQHIVEGFAEQRLQRWERPQRLSEPAHRYCRPPRLTGEGF